LNADQYLSGFSYSLLQGISFLAEYYHVMLLVKDLLVLFSIQTTTPINERKSYHQSILGSQIMHGIILCKAMLSLHDKPDILMQNDFSALDNDH